MGPRGCLDDQHQDRGERGQGVAEHRGLERALGFLDLAGVAAGHHVADAADGEKQCGDGGEVPTSHLVALSKMVLSWSAQPDSWPSTSTTAASSTTTTASPCTWYKGTDHELRVHTDPEIDLDYYAIELGRLIALTEEIDRLFHKPAEIDQARATFLAVAPQAKDTRNALIHFDDRPRLDNVVFLGGAIRRLHPDGRVEHLVDARYEQHDAALSLVDAVGQWLRGHLHEAIAADPAAPLHEQIRNRAAGAS